MLTWSAPVVKTKRFVDGLTEVGYVQPRRIGFGGSMFISSGLAWSAIPRTRRSTMTQLPTLKNGSKSGAVKGLKNALMVRLDEFDLFDRPLSEDFGPKTEHAVTSFQSGASLDVDGIVGPITWKALDVVLVEPGDTLSGIAEAKLGVPGQVLVLPFTGTAHAGGGGR